MQQRTSELQQANQELQITLEELQVSEEELRQQNEKLAISRQAIELERQRYQDLFQFAPDGYLVTDIWGNIREANCAAATLLSIRQKRLIGKPMLVFIAEPERKAFRTRLAQLREVQGWEIYLKPCSGDPFPAMVAVSSIHDKQEQSVGWRWLLRDISDRKQMEQQLQAAHNELEKRVEERTTALKQANYLLKEEITERKRREANAAFLAEIAKDFSRLSSAEEIIQAIGVKIGADLNVTSCNFCEVDESRDQVVYLGRWNVEGEQRLPDRICLREQVSEDFYRRIHAGETIVSNNTQTNSVTNAQANAPMGALSFITVPFHKDGEWKYLFSIHEKVPRTWREDEIELVRELANRTFPRLERARAEAGVAADLKDTQLLRDLSARLISEDNIQVLYNEIMAAAITLMRADGGTFQILDEATQELVLLASQGFDRTMTEHFARVDTRLNTPCSVALATGKRSLIDFDVPESDDLNGHLRIHLNAGYLCAQSTPLISRSGRAIGMVSTHWHNHHQPSDREQRFLDLLARQAADLIEQRQAELEIRKFVSLADNSTEFIGMCDMNFVPFYINPAGMQLLGLNDIHEYRKTSVREFFFPEDQDFIINEFFSRVLNEGQAEVEIRFRHFKTEEALWMLYSVFCIKDTNDQLIGLATVSYNITERKQAQEKIQEQAALLDVAGASSFGRNTFKVYVKDL